MNSKRISNVIKMLALVICLIGLYEITIRNNKVSDDNSSTVGSEASLMTSYDFAMGTSINVNVYGGDKALNQSLIDSIKFLDSSIISWRAESSELYKLNNSYKANEQYEVSDSLFEAVAKAYDICRDSDGALDITIRPLARVWNIDNPDNEEFRIPDASAITDSLKNVGYEKITVSDNTITISSDNMMIDLGAVGKGYALDYITTILQSQDVSGAVISVGGSVMTYGQKEDGTAFRVGIRNPRGSIDDMTGYITIPSGVTKYISTSGDYEKYYMLDGKRYHHILDRSTGYPAQSGLISVTVVCDNGLYSDALSTACFVLGYDKALELLKKYDAEAVFIDTDGNIKVTDGLKESFHLQ